LKTGYGGEYLGPRGIKMGSGGLYNKELNSLYRSPNIVRVIRSSRLRWTGHVTTMEGKVGVLSKF
jgi:Purine-nucleoside phosphorylase